MTTHITSLHNERVKAAIRLRDRKGREQQGRIIIDGERAILRAAAAKVVIEELYWDTSFRESPAGKETLSQLTTGRGGASFECTPAVFAKLAYGERDSGIVAVARTPDISLVAFSGRLKARQSQQHSAALICILEGVEKPGNVGAVLRTADAAGIQGLIVASGGTDLFNPNAIRASAGAIFTVPVAAATTAETLAWLRERQMKMVAARVDALANYTACDFIRPTAIVLGSEAQGLTSAWHAPDVESICLPMRGQIDSLNVSVTAAVLFYEALRQRSRSES